MIRKYNKENKKGFTLIELMLAVAFLGTLLLSVAMLAMRLVDMYTKGSTMRAINSIGSAIVDDVRSHVTSSATWGESLKDGLDETSSDKTKHQYYRFHTRTVAVSSTENESFVDFGAFCTNSYTYIFNYQAAMLKYREHKKTYAVHDLRSDDYLMIGTSNDNKRPYALARIKDPGCGQFKRLDMTQEEFNVAKLSDGTKLADADSYFWDDNEFWFGPNDERFIKVNDVEKDVTVLLDGAQSDEGTDLQLYDFGIMSATQSDATKQTLYDIAFVLGTTRGGINVKSSNNYCNGQKQNSDENDFAADMANNSIEYCSVNRFEFVVRQTGEKE